MLTLEHFSDGEWVVVDDSIPGQNELEAAIEKLPGGHSGAKIRVSNTETGELEFEQN